MKKTIVSLFAVFTAATVIAGPMEQGMYEVRTEAGHGFDSYASVALIGGLGYFVTDNIAVGALVSFEKMEWESYWGKSDLWGLGGYAEYTFDLDNVFYPFAGAQVLFYSGNQNMYEEDMVPVFSLSGGFKAMVNDIVALTLRGNINFAGEEIFRIERPDDTDGKSVGFSIAAGVSFMLR